MPQIIPDDIEQFTTRGEEAFYRFLSFAAKADDSFLKVSIRLNSGMSIAG